MFRTIVITLALLVGGCSGSIATLFIDKQFHSQEELAQAPMGWPFTFVHQNLSGYTPMSWPQSFSFVQPQDNPVSIHLGWFAANVVVLAAAILVLARFALRLLRAKGNRSKA